MVSVQGATLTGASLTGALQTNMLPAAVLLTAALLTCGCASPEARRQGAFARADAALAAGDANRAAAILGAQLAYDPRDVSTAGRLAALWLDEGRPLDAVAALEAVPADTDPGPEVRALMARARLGAGQGKRAAALFAQLDGRFGVEPQELDRLLELLACRPETWPPKPPATWTRRLLDHQLRAGCLDAAVELWRRGLPADAPPSGGPAPEALLDRLLRRLVLAGEVELLLRLPERGAPPETPWKLLARHHLLLQRGAEGEAKRVEDRFLDRFPDHPQRFRVLLVSARREIRAGRFGAGLERAQEAAALEPSRVGPLIEQALALDGLGRPREADRVLEQALALEPNSPALQRLTDPRRKGGSAAGRIELRFQTAEE
ncbi:MAG: tetratricopeptide repeat protein [Acidobacteriota bacterium]